MAAKEVVIIVLVLVFWLCAILLFINRWGKIRMLEPYMPDYKSIACEEANATNPSTRMNSMEEGSRAGGVSCGVSCGAASGQRVAPLTASAATRDGAAAAGGSGGGAGGGGGGAPQFVVERRSSLLLSLPSLQQWTSMRRVKSAVDLVSLVIAERREATAEQRRSRFQRRGRYIADHDRHDRRVCHICRHGSRLLSTASATSVRLLDGCSSVCTPPHPPYPPPPPPLHLPPTPPQPRPLPPAAATSCSGATSCRWPQRCSASGATQRPLAAAASVATAATTVATPTIHTRPIYRVEKSV